MNELRRKTEQIIHEIQEQYLEDDTPWVIKFSGGKDSTATLQLIFYALSDLPAWKLSKSIHILANDTLVENPKVASFLEYQLQHIEIAGKKELFAHLPDLFHVVKTTPKPNGSFWFYLIGRGYPSPNRFFRWCMERLKFNPTDKYILDVIGKYEKVLIVLGTRYAESSNRSNSMKQHEIPGTRLQKVKAPNISNAYAFSPIANLTTQEVWTYLINNSCPWGIENQKLLNLYRSASDIMECPVSSVEVGSTCGNSRFGCWVCTVIDKDRSLTYMIENDFDDDEWMQPLLEFRNWLRIVRDEEVKREKYTRKGQHRPGPFTLEARKEILEKLLKLESETQRQFITVQELAAIQAQWDDDGNIRYSVARIYNEKKGEKLTMIENPREEERKKEELEVLEKVCLKFKVDPGHLMALITLERKHTLQAKRRNIHKEIQDKIAGFTRVSKDNMENLNEDR